MEHSALETLEYDGWHLPTSWDVVRLGDIAKSSGGFGFPIAKQGRKDGEYPFFKVSDMNLPGNEKFMRSSNNWIDQPTLKQLKAKTFPKSAIVFPKIGAALLTNKKRMLVRDSVIDNNVMAVVVNDESDCFPEYLYQWFLTLDLGRIANMGTVPSLTSGRLEEVRLPLPPLSEQRNIAGVLGVVQRAIEQQERLLQLTAELKKTLLHQLFTQGLRGEPQKQTEIGLVPESWKVVRLEDICTFLSGGTPSKQKPEFWVGTIPWVSPKDMKRPRLADVVDHISDAALEDSSALAPAGSVFVVIRGMILAKDVPVALAEVPMAFNQDMKTIIPGPRIVPSYLLYALVAFKQNLFQKVGRSAHGTMTLMSRDLSQFSIPLPDRQTQEEIAAAITTGEKKYEQHRRKHATLSGLFCTLLHQLMTAQIRVRDFDLSLQGSVQGVFCGRG